MNFKVSFTNGEWRTVVADGYTLDEALVVFLKNGEPVLTCFTANMLFLEPLPAEKEKPFALG